MYLLVYRRKSVYLSLAVSKLWGFVSRQKKTQFKSHVVFRYTKKVRKSKRNGNLTGLYRIYREPGNYPRGRFKVSYIRKNIILYRYSQLLGKPVYCFCRLGALPHFMHIVRIIIFYNLKTQRSSSS